MKLIALSDPLDIKLRNVLDSLAHKNSSQVLTFSQPNDFKEAVRANIVPKPVIVFCVSNQSSFCHLSEIEDYIVDSVLFLILPDEGYYQSYRKEISVYPRYVFYMEDDHQLLLAMLNKLETKK